MVKARVRARHNTPRDNMLCLLLVGAFGVLYCLQVPSTTAIGDVLVYALRSTSESPLLSYPFLDTSGQLVKSDLYDYHLGFTVLLWWLYQFIPETWSATIYPSGLMSAVAGALSVGLTFLIARCIGFDQRTSFIVGVVAALIPSLWYSSLIGEVYALQHVFTLAFVYAFLIHRIILCAAFLLIAVLISPLAGLGMGLLLLAPWRWSSVINAVLVGAAALVAYVAIFTFIGADILTLFASDATPSVGRSGFWLSGKFLAIVALNLCCFSVLLVRGVMVMWGSHQHVLIALMIAVVPPTLISILDGTFLRGLGSFQLLILWMFAVPIGVGVVHSHRWLLSISIPIVGATLLTMLVWIWPASDSAQSRLSAAEWLKEHVPTKPITLIGGWDDGVGVATALNGWDLDRVTNTLQYVYRPSTADVLALDKPEVYVIAHNPHFLRELLAALPFGALKVKRYDPHTHITQGTIDLVFENKVVRIYRWRAS